MWCMRLSLRCQKYSMCQEVHNGDWQNLLYTDMKKVLSYFCMGLLVLSVSTKDHSCGQWLYASIVFTSFPKGLCFFIWEPLG